MTVRKHQVVPGVRSGKPLPLGDHPFRRLAIVRSLFGITGELCYLSHRADSKDGFERKVGAAFDKSGEVVGLVLIFRVDAVHNLIVCPLLQDAMMQTSVIASLMGGGGAHVCISHDK